METEKRTIKFRAWDKENSRMIYLGWNWQNDYDTIPIDDNWEDTVDPNDLEFMQYVGLKDSNGKEIYEGDILRYVMDAKGQYLWICEFKNGAFVMTKDFRESGSDRLLSDYSKHHSVIGNIYENPDLVAV